MDLTNIGFVALMTIGFVNVLSFWKPNMDSKVKIGVSIAFAFTLTFVPADLGNLIANKVKEAVEIALLATGGYKVAQKVGGQ